MSGLESALAIAPLVIEAGELSEKLCGILRQPKRNTMQLKKLGARVKWYEELFNKVANNGELNRNPVAFVNQYLALLKEVDNFIVDMNRSSGLETFLRAKGNQHKIEDFASRLDYLAVGFNSLMATRVYPQFSMVMAKLDDLQKMLAELTVNDAKFKKELLDCNVDITQLTIDVEEELEETIHLSGKNHLPVAEVDAASIPRFHVDEFMPYIPNLQRKAERLGAGAFGTVFKAFFKGRFVAVKVLKDASLPEKCLKEIFHEFAMMAKLGPHPNVLGAHGVVIVRDEFFCLVTDFVPQGSLRKFHENCASTGHRYDWAKKVCWAKGIANGMAHLHSSNPPIIHRDLKSNNILL